MDKIRKLFFEYISSKPKDEFTVKDLVTYAIQKGYKIDAVDVIRILNKAVTDNYLELIPKPLSRDNDNSCWYTAGRKLKELNR